MQFKYLVLRALAAIIYLLCNRGDKNYHATIADQCTRAADRLQETANGELAALQSEYGRKK